MAALLNFDIENSPSRVDADQAMNIVLDHLTGLPARVAVPLISSYRGRLDAAEARALATAVGTNGDTKTAERIAGRRGKASKRARKKAAKRAKAVKKNPDLADSVDNGDLSSEHLDVLADADERTDGASLTDTDLIDKVADANPDQAKSIIDDYIADNANANHAQTRHDKQRRKRRVSRFKTKDDDLEAIMFAGDKATIDRIWNETVAAADTLYRNDGGRDLPQQQHPRTHNNRLFDALTDAILRRGSGGTCTAATCTSSNGIEHESEPTCGTAPNSAAARRSKRHTPTNTTSRPAVVIAATLDKLTGLAPHEAARMIGHGPIADTVLAQYLAADPDIVGTIFGAGGQPLWLGRSTRFATKAQLLALIVRDKHCVLCGAEHTRCIAHHTMPWSSRGRGQTDIDQLVLVCHSCHHYIHDHEQTIHRASNSGHWTLRPALPHEIPPPRPPPGNGHHPHRT